MAVPHTRLVMMRALNNARAMTPFDTGHLRFSAVRARTVKNGFEIIVDFNQAPYGYFLQKGRGNTKYHEGWIDSIFENTKGLIQEYFVNPKTHHNRAWTKQAEQLREQKHTHQLRERQLTKMKNRNRKVGWY